MSKLTGDFGNLRMAELAKDFSRPPDRMAELLVAASDESRLSEPPRGEITVYHGTQEPFMGPPTPREHGGMGWQPPVVGSPSPKDRRTRGWRVPGLFMSNDPSAALEYMGWPQSPHDDVYAARRVFETRLDPERIYRIRWPAWQDIPDYMRSMQDAQRLTNERIRDEAHHRSEDFYRGLAGFMERYDAVMPPPYDRWGDLGDDRWQVILFDPQFSGLQLPHPAVRDFSPIWGMLDQDRVRRGLTTVDDALAGYAEAGGEGDRWAHSVVDRGRQIQPPFAGADAHYKDRITYKLFRDRSKYMSELLWRNTQPSPDQLREWKDKLASIMEQLGPAKKPRRERAVPVGPEKPPAGPPQQGRLF